MHPGSRAKPKSMKIAAISAKYESGLRFSKWEYLFQMYYNLLRYFSFGKLNWLTHITNNILGMYKIGVHPKVNNESGHNFGKLILASSRTFYDVFRAITYRNKTESDRNQANVQKGFTYIKSLTKLTVEKNLLQLKSHPDSTKSQLIAARWRHIAR